MKHKDTKKISIFINLIIVLWTLYSLYCAVFGGLKGNMSGSNWAVFKYYTIDSNVFSAVSALVMFCARAFKGQPGRLSTNLKYYGTCTVTVTLITVLVFLGPNIGYAEMFEGENLYLHLIGPLLAIISFCFLDRGPKLSITQVWKSLIATGAYAAFYGLQVLVLHNWKDFYGFTTNRLWYISAIAMMTGAFVIGVIIKALHNDK